jgi:5-methylcytosine-specific restriction endonuclease McrA
MVGRDTKTVHWWLRKFQIPTRPHGCTRESVANRKRGQGALRGRGHTPEAVARIRAASIARGAVPYLRDGKHWLKDAAPEDNPNWKGGVTPERQAFYRTRRWKAAVKAVWARADGCCERCELDFRTIDRKTTRFHIHHLISFAVIALRTEVRNLRLLCQRCHRWVHSRANTERELLGPEPTDDPNYFLDAVAYLQAEERKQSMPSLFDSLEDVEAVA